MRMKYDKTPPGKWSNSMLATLFGLTGPVYGRYLNGLSYPTLQTMQKFEAVMGWPVSEQVQLIPPFWEWPPQDTRTHIEATDLRYGMKLRQVAREWGDANPRTVLSSDVRLHPAITPRAGRHR